MIRVFTNILLVLLFISCESNKSDNVKLASKSNSSKKWNYLFYCAADSKNIYNPLKDFSSLVSSNKDINYLVLSDSKDHGGAYYFIDSIGNSIKLLDLGNINMGDSTTLSNFIDYSNQHFPAQRNILAFYNHGGGWKGTCWDSSHDGDNLTLHDMETSLSHYNNIELLMFTAPCYMSSVEAIYQLSESANYFIGSEDISGFVHWQGMLSEFDNFIKNNLDISGQDLCINIISMHKNNINEKYGDKLTLSAINLKKVNEFNISLNNLFKYYIDNPSKIGNLDKKKIEIFGKSYIGLYNILLLLENCSTNEIQRKLINDAKLNFSNIIVANISGIDMNNYFGVNIRYPNYSFYFEPYKGKSSIGLKFITESKWSEFLKLLFKSKKQKETA